MTPIDAHPLLAPARPRRSTPPPRAQRLARRAQRAAHGRAFAPRSAGLAATIGATAPVISSAPPWPEGAPQRRSRLPPPPRDAPMTSFDVLVSMLSVAGHIGLGAVASARLRRTPLARPLLLLAFVMALWTLSARANRMHLDREVWHWIGATVAPWLPYLAVEYIYAFLGRRRDLPRLLALGLTLSLSIVALLGRFSARFDALERSAAWDVSFLALLALSLGLSTLRMWQSRDAFVDARARFRFRAAAVGWLVGFVGGVAETLADFRLPVPRIGPLCLLFTASILAAGTLRDARHDRSDAFTQALAGAAVLISVIAQTIALLALSPREAVLMASTASLVLLGGIVAWVTTASVRSARARDERLRFLGHVSDQFAHDIRNPLAAIRGAIDFLRVELEDVPLSADGEAREMLDLVESEARRVEGMLELYRRLGDRNPETQPVDLAAIAERAIRSVSFDGDASVDARALVPVLAEVDPALVLPAIENVLKNAIEAAGPEGRVIVATDYRDAWARVLVSDDGGGIAPEVSAWVTRPYATSKPQGFGLGLSLVRRVVDAHEGQLVFSRATLGGACVELWFERAETT